MRRLLMLAVIAPVVVANKVFDLLDQLDDIVIERIDAKIEERIDAYMHSQTADLIEEVLGDR